MSTVIEEKVSHNHKSVYGRYVEGCPRCQQLHPDGPPAKPAKKAKAEAPAQAAPLTMEQVLEALKAFGYTLGTELRKPDPEVEAEKAAEKQRTRLSMEAELKIVQEAEQQKFAIQAACEASGHRQNGGRSAVSAISGQICSDGLRHDLCVSCGKEFKPYKPRPDQIM